MSMTATNTPDEGPDERDIRAAVEEMVVVPYAPRMFHVYSGVRAVYLVDIVNPACDCADFQYRQGGEQRRCKHIRRVEMTMRMREIPDGVDPDPVLLRQRGQEPNDR